MRTRNQRTLARSLECTGVGIFTNADVKIRFCPAPENHGIQFVRTDLAGSQPIPALIEYAVFKQRRTAIEFQGASVEMIEHVMAALAGMQIDNCRIEINAPEAPCFDGSSQELSLEFLEAGIVEQPFKRDVICIEQPVSVEDDSGSFIQAKPLNRSVMAVGYYLNYGEDSPIPPQCLTLEINPDTWMNQLAFSRTFVLEEEVEAMRGLGYGLKLSAEDLLVIGQQGVIDNELRTLDECVRHKILDCLGDFALIGCDLQGYFCAQQSGHALNRELIKKIKSTHQSRLSETAWKVA
ncbi:MAG: UDP-3-O-acyl-N-acetylglucosamine deacetylase [Planctomycetes bacterium]|nr:UDP-3-O-acyl-N-acetylglucosamine deacetylase [Planctomycetota bacterium]MCH9726043.1 UDP-3-O-acyl-N-acetylglucosamine deacetylase [Planctomycetota bacterium]MCH9777195.1 UDP-3-O-acyl-N-acetylglucosamine deacetylase [Planctomycetota bacterium]MCH9790385.1 UDP-3-O-acyl-N-acetylglucosamine deacetylase [Planctomycetota bacterium]MDF1742344.1 UDP-3-O-acyl-N-acetylglucosamine deacetylase [Gimesia sp.]